MIRTMFAGWQAHGADPDARVRARVEFEANQLRTGYVAALWAMEKYLKDTNHQVSERIRQLRLEIQRELGAVASAVARVAGPVALWTSRREARRFPLGRPLEPRSFVERRLRTA